MIGARRDELRHLQRRGFPHREYVVCSTVDALANGCEEDSGKKLKVDGLERDAWRGVA